jgi:hypothetical protein
MLNHPNRIGPTMSITSEQIPALRIALEVVEMTALDLNLRAADKNSRAAREARVKAIELRDASDVLRQMIANVDGSA